MILKGILIFAVMLSATVIFAQPGGSSGGGSSSGGAPPPSTGAPIDGGASIFLIGVAAYAHRKLKAKPQIPAEKK